MPHNSANGLRLAEVTFGFQPHEEHAVLQACSLTIAPNKITAISGRSGCGKSTLLMLLSGLYPEHGGYLFHGKVSVDGLAIDTFSPKTRAETVAVMFQNPELQFCMDTVENEIIFCLENLRLAPAEIDYRLTQALQFCDIEALRDRQLHTLSGGEKQRVILACMVALQSRYLLLDEPFANLDPVSAYHLCCKLRQYQQKQACSIVIIDHHIEPLQPFCDELLLLGAKGEVIAQRDISRQHLTIEELQHFGLLPVKQPTEHRPLNEAKPLFTLNAVTLKQGDRHLFTTDYQTFHQQRLIALTGASGCGKSTLLATLARMHPYQGSIQLYAPAQKHPREISTFAIKRYAPMVGIVFQDPQDQFVTERVIDEIRFSLQGYLQEPELSQHAQAQLTALGLWHYRNRAPYSLSQGEQRKLAVTVLLACRCRILLCDEPTYGLDAFAAENLMTFLAQKVAHEGVSILFTTHDLGLATHYSDDWFAIEKGQLITLKQNGERQE